MDLPPLRCVLGEPNGNSVRLRYCRDERQPEAVPRRPPACVQAIEAAEDISALTRRYTGAIIRDRQLRSSRFRARHQPKLNQGAFLGVSDGILGDVGYHLRQQGAIACDVTPSATCPFKVWSLSSAAGRYASRTAPVIADKSTEPNTTRASRDSIWAMLNNPA